MCFFFIYYTHSHLWIKTFTQSTAGPRAANALVTLHDLQSRHIAVLFTPHNFLSCDLESWSCCGENTQQAGIFRLSFLTPPLPLAVACCMAPRPVPDMTRYLACLIRHRDLIWLHFCVTCVLVSFEAIPFGWSLLKHLATAEVSFLAIASMLHNNVLPLGYNPLYPLHKRNRLIAVVHTNSQSHLADEAGSL